MSAGAAVRDPVVERIEALKKRRDAIILAHNYQIGEIQEVADFVGDSLELSRYAARTSHPVIVFCGVHFMAETAKVLSPDKTVVVPDLRAGCPMSDMITPEEVRALRARHPGAIVVTYVNSSAAVKAESDICCTSANAVAIVKSLPADRPILFIPDRYLGEYVQRQTGRDLLLYSGFCPTHVRIMATDIARERESHPDALVIAHPECPAPVAEAADVVASTSRMASEVRLSDKKTVIVGTELGMIHRLSRENPEKTFIPACQTCDCANMKVNSLERLLWSLEDLSPEIRLSDEVISGARRALDRMLEVS
jgi:quinolinate synthase